MKASIYFNNRTHPKLDDLLYEFDDLDSIEERVVFFNEPLGINLKNTAMMHAKNIWKWNGPILATCIQSGLYTHKCPVSSRKIMYVSSVSDWVTPIAANKNIKIYGSFELFCSNEVNPEMLKNIWNNDKIITGSLKEVFKHD